MIEKINLKSASHVLLLIITSMILLLELNLLFHFFYAVLHHEIKPNIPGLLNDGTAYYLASQAFYFFKTGSLLSYFLNQFQPFGLILHGGGHGFAYSVLYGSLAHLLGNHLALIPLMNVFYLLASATIIWLSFPTFKQKTLATFILFTIPLVVVNQVTYMQFMLQLLFAAIFINILCKKNTKVIHVITLLIFASLFRPIYLLGSPFIVLLAPKVSTRKKVTAFFLLLFLATFISTIYLKYSSAVDPANPTHKIIHALFSLNLKTTTSLAIKQFKTNSLRYLFSMKNDSFNMPIAYLIMRYVYLVSVIASIYYGYKNNNYKLKFCGFLSLYSLLLILFLYKSTGWRDMRSLSFFFLANVGMLAYAKKYKILSTILVMLILSLPSSYPQSLRLIRARATKLDQKIITANKKMKRFNCILLQGDYFNYKLPLSNKHGKIKYYYVLRKRKALKKSGFLPCYKYKKLLLNMLQPRHQRLMMAKITR